jgi:hypothetical protein
MRINLFGKKYHHLNKIFVNQTALHHNHNELHNFHPEANIAPVLKSNAYGHGLKIVAPVFDKLNPAFLVVDSLYEAYELTKLKVKSQILILGYIHPDNFSVKQLPFHITVFDLEVARSLNKYQKNCKVHIFVDTGMCREGVQLSELKNFTQEIKKMINLEIVGLASHFADADNPNDEAFTQKQIANYKKASRILEEEGITPRYRHISASGASFKIKDEVGQAIETAQQSIFGPTDPAKIQQQQLEQAQKKQEDQKKIANIKQFLNQMAQDEQQLRQKRQEEQQEKMQKQQEEHEDKQEEEMKKQKKEESFQQQHIQAEQTKAERKLGVGG